MGKKKIKRSKVYRRVPVGYHLVDPARSLSQAKALRAGYPKDAKAIIVQTGSARGKNRDVFPYHIASGSPYY